MRLPFVVMLFLISKVMAEPVQIKKPVMCESTPLVFQALSDQAGEKPIWLGKGDGVDTSRTVILANETTKTWTIVQFDKDMACILGSGVDSRQIFTGPII